MTKAKSKLNFESALLEIESIVETMESEDTSLEKSITSYRRGIELMQFCRKELEAAQTEINVLDEGLLKKLDEEDSL